MLLWKKFTDLMVTRFFRVSHNATMRVEYSEGKTVDVSPMLLASGRHTFETGLTAHSGGTQAAALALAAAPTTVHEVTTVGAAADSVKLPLATGSGVVHVVKNSAAVNSMQLYGSGTDTIDGVATATGVAVAAGKARYCIDATAGNWISVAGA